MNVTICQGTAPKSQNFTLTSPCSVCNTSDLIKKGKSLSSGDKFGGVEGEKQPTFTLNMRSYFGQETIGTRSPMHLQSTKVRAIVAQKVNHIYLWFT